MVSEIDFFRHLKNITAAGSLEICLNVRKMNYGVRNCFFSSSKKLQEVHDR